MAAAVMETRSEKKRERKKDNQQVTADHTGGSHFFFFFEAVLDCRLKFSELPMLVCSLPWPSISEGGLSF